MVPLDGTTRSVVGCSNGGPRMPMRPDPGSPGGRGDQGELPERLMFARIASTCWIAVLSFGMPAVAGDEVRLNQIQVIGTHNSYHLAPHPNVAGLIGARGRAVAGALDYTHRPLAEQFSILGIRQIELDLYADPEGGHYAQPTARKILRGLGREPGPDPDEGGAAPQARLQGVPHPGLRFPIDSPYLPRCPPTGPRLVGGSSPACPDPGVDRTQGQRDPGPAHAPYALRQGGAGGHRRRDPLGLRALSAAHPGRCPGHAHQRARGPPGPGLADARPGPGQGHVRPRRRRRPPQNSTWPTTRRFRVGCSSSRWPTTIRPRPG